jgi:phenylalanyl-tRNA synthetase beta chain
VLVDAYSEERPRPMKKLKPSKIRGVESSGMVCSERELGLSEEHEGIILLPEEAPVGTPLRDYLGDSVLELDLTVDLARCFNMIGIAREISALTDAPLHLPPDEFGAEGDDQASDYVAVRIDEPALCNRYTAILIQDVAIGPSPTWMQDRLTKAGMRPINNVVDITNYVMLEWGQPLHAFDYDILVRRAQQVGDVTPTIVVRRAAADEKFTTLDEVERKLDDSMLMIADTLGSVAIAGVMGGLESEVTDNTRTVLLESATFDGINSRRTSRALKLFSEASFRFARGIPPKLNDIAARRAADLMRQHAGGRLVPGMVDAYPVVQSEPIVYTTASDMARILGMPVTLLQASEALERLNFQVRVVDEPAAHAPVDATFGLVRQAGEPLLECVGPWHRLDIRYPADLCEEVARIIGYEHAGSTLIQDELPPQRTNAMVDTEEKIRDILIGCGLQDTINYALTTPENHARLVPSVAGSANGAGDGDGNTQYITLTNPVALERRAMRRTMLVSALENLQYNLRYTSRLAMFEIGRVYLPENAEGPRPVEDRRVCIVLAGPRQPQSFYSTAESSGEMDFYDLKGVVETLLERLGFKQGEFEFHARPDAESFGPRCAEVYVGGQSIGLAGEIHPRVRAAFDLPAATTTRVNIAELRIEPLVRSGYQKSTMRPISSMPPVVEDLAFVVNEEITLRKLEQAIRAAGADLLAAVELFDLYRGEPLPAGTKSLAFRVTYQGQEANLRDADVVKLRERIVRRVERETGGKLRG